MIVCEIGLNHFGSEEYSWEYLDVLLESECDAITYQIREPDFYKNEFADFRLSMMHYGAIKEACEDHGKQFGIALADPNKIAAFNDIGADFYKTLSWDLLNFDFIDKLIKSGRKIFVSTGTATNRDLYDFMKQFPCWKTMDDLGTCLSEYITLIHTQLSFEVEDVNLAAISSMKDMGYPVAFGNHCRNLNVIYSSVAMEPSDIFVYIKGERSYEHPDEVHAVAINEAPFFLQNIKEMQLAIGDGQKVKSETKIWNSGLEGKV